MLKVASRVLFTGPPDLPSVVTIEVTSTSSVMVYFAESDNKDSSITTKFRGKSIFKFLNHIVSCWCTIHRGMKISCLDGKL